MELNHPELTQQALHLLRNGEHFEWHVIPMLAFVMYIYYSEVAAKNWRGIASGLSLYGVHWLFEIGNALIQHFSGHALWAIPQGTAYLLLVGVGVEISLMFSIAGLIASKLLPPDPTAKVFGINNRLFFALANAAFCAVAEIFLVTQTGVFAWVYPWWGALPVFVTVYIPFFLTAMRCHDWEIATQKRFIGGLFALDAVLLLVFGVGLRWI